MNLIATFFVRLSAVLSTLSLPLVFGPSVLAQETNRLNIFQSVTEHGSRLLSLDAPEIPIIDIAIEIDAGSRWDPLGKEGLASMTAAMAFRGLKAQAGRPSIDEASLGRVWADTAIERSGGVSQDRASLRFRLLSDLQIRHSAVEAIGRVLADPAFESDVFLREQARALAGLKEGLTRPQTLATRALWQAMYPNHAYGRHETEASLAALSVEDLSVFHQQFWRPERITIIIVGDIRQADALALSNALIAPLASLMSNRQSEANPLTPPAVLPSVAPTVKGAFISIEHPANQSHLWFGMPIIARHEINDFFPLLVANHILGGGGFTSRLTREVRENRGLSYSVFSAVSPLSQMGPFFIGLQTQRERAQEALEVVRLTVANFMREGPSQEEIDAAKKNLLGGFALRLDSNRKLLDNLAQIGFYRMPINYLDRWSDAVSLVTKEDIQSVLRQRFSIDRLSTVIVGGSADPAQASR